FLGRGAHTFVRVAECPVALPALAPVFAEKVRAGSPQRFLAYGNTGSDGASHLARADEANDTEIIVGVLGRYIVFPLRGFFQRILEMSQRLIPHALAGLSGPTAFDLSSGVGLFGEFHKDSFERMVCVEFNRHALAYARR